MDFKRNTRASRRWSLTGLVRSGFVGYSEKGLESPLDNHGKGSGTEIEFSFSSVAATPSYVRPVHSQTDFLRFIFCILRQNNRHTIYA